MKNKMLATIVAFSLLLLGQRALAADTNNAATELKDLVTKVRAKLAQGKPTEKELGDELKQFDTLLAEHQGEKTDDVARILMMKAMLYQQVLDNTNKAAELISQLKRDFPDTKVVASIKQQEQAEKIQAGLVAGAMFPAFDEKDINGRSFSVANYKGKVVLIDFWATWCGPCVRELPNVLETYKKYHPKGFEIVGISLDEDKSKLTSFIKDKEVAWQQYFDGQGWQNKLAAKYGIQSIPATFLLDGDGKIIAKDLRGEALGEGVSKALAAK